MTDKKQFEIVDDGLLVRAPAKINLSLLIAGKRADGFHEIETIMAKINWYDEILIQQGQKAGIELICTGEEWAPEGKENLVYQAAEMLLDSCGSQNVIPAKAGIKITLTKNIPAGTGLGSASSDAAATLIGVKKFLKLKISRQQINEIAAKLGSDIPFFLDGPLAFCTGRGEKIRKLTKKFDFPALLVLPNISVSTKTVYANYNDNEEFFRKLNPKINTYIKKNRIDLIAKMCANMLEVSCFGLYKELANLKFKIESSGVSPLCLSGSGSAMFCIMENSCGEKMGISKSKLEREFGCRTIMVRNNKW